MAAESAREGGKKKNGGNVKAMFPRDEHPLQTVSLDEPVEYLTAYNIQGLLIQ